MNIKRKTKRIPVLTQEEFNELGRVMSANDKELEEEYWKKVYARRNLFFIREEDLVKEFDELVANGKLRIDLVKGISLSDLSEEDKISLMHSLKELEINESKY